MTTKTPDLDHIIDSDDLAKAVEFWRGGVRMSEVPHDVLVAIAASHEALRRELDELRSSVNERDAEVSRLRAGAATAADDLEYVINGISTGMPARENAEEIDRIKRDLARLLGVEDTKNGETK